jgi:hypothetical protein
LPRRLGYRVGGRQGDYGGGEQGGAEKLDPEQRRRRAAGERLERLGGVLGVVDLDPVHVQRRGACDDHEEPDHTGEDRADDHVNVLVAEVLDVEVLVGCVGLDEDEAPRRQRCSDRRNGDEDGIARERDIRHDQALGRLAPVGVGEEARGDIGDEHGAQREQHVFDPVEGAAKDQQGDADRGERHADVAADPAEQVEPSGDAGELGAHRADVGDYEGGHLDARVARAPVQSHQGHKAASGDNAHPRAKQVKDDQRGGRDREHPLQLIAVLGAQDRIGRDAGRVVIREPGEDSRAHHSEQRRDIAAPELRAVAKEAGMQMPARPADPV